jgi:hypothetical protein
MNGRRRGAAQEDEASECLDITVDLIKHLVSQHSFDANRLYVPAGRKGDGGSNHVCTWRIAHAIEGVRLVVRAGQPIKPLRWLPSPRRWP